MKPIEHSTLIKPIYDSLKTMIISQKLKPGEKIIQEKIASELGVSRTPLMRALQLLENDYLVESIPRRGMYVREFSVEEMIDVYHCRESIECMAVRLAVERSVDKELKILMTILEQLEKSCSKQNKMNYAQIDGRFHNSIIELSKNKVLERMSQISNVQSCVYSLGLLREPEETMQEHRDIVQAILDRDSVRAENEMRSHILLSREVLENKLKEKITNE